MGLGRHSLRRYHSTLTYIDWPILVWAVRWWKTFCSHYDRATYTVSFVYALPNDDCRSWEQCCSCSRSIWWKQVRAGRWALRCTLWRLGTRWLSKCCRKTWRLSAHRGSTTSRRSVELHVASSTNSSYISLARLSRLPWAVHAPAIDGLLISN